MAVVTNSFSVAANAAWASPTWSANNPSWKLDIELSNWVTALNDTNKLEIIRTPGHATSRSSTSLVAWFLRTAEADPDTDCGIMFKGRYAGTSNANGNGFIGSYHNRTVSTSNNGYGTYSYITYTTNSESFTSIGTIFTAYEATGDTPWFLYAWENSARTDRRFDLILRCDTTNITSGSYYPTYGLSKWVYAFGAGNSNNLVCPQNSYSFPFKGINSSGTVLRHPTPTYSGYFFRMGAQYGNLHYLGHVTNDILVSNNVTGQFGDTTVIDGATFTCIGNHAVSGNYWVKTS